MRKNIVIYYKTYLVINNQNFTLLHVYLDIKNKYTYIHYNTKTTMLFQFINCYLYFSYINYYYYNSNIVSFQIVINSYEINK